MQIIRKHRSKINLIEAGKAVTPALKLSMQGIEYALFFEGR